MHCLEQPDKSAIPFWVRIVWDLCWVWAAIGITIAAARLLAHDRHFVLVVANCLSLYLYAPAALVFPIAIWQSRRYLATVSCLLLAAQVVWVWPDFLPSQQPQIADGTPVLRIFSANVYMSNQQPNGIIEEIKSCDPDIILFQEFSSVWRRALNRSDLLETYPHSMLLSREDSFGVAVFSKVPLIDKSMSILGGIPIISIVIQLQGTPVRIHNWHPLPPRTPEYFDNWNRQYEALLNQLSQDTGPTLIIGDFNATQNNLWMKRLLHRGYQSAHVQTGRGYATTYPNGTSLAPPIRLDHALMSRHFACPRIREGLGHGSDHKPLIIDFALL